MKNKIKGGKASSMSIEDIAKKHKVDISVIQKQIEIGRNIEKEHTSDDMMAKEIAMDHLTEFPDYYTRLKKMEKVGEKSIEAKESIGADSSGSFESPLTNNKNKTVILKKDIHNWKSKQQEVDEITDSSSSGSYDAPIGHGGDPLKIDNPGLPKTGTITASKEGKGFKNKAMKYMPGSKFVDVKKQCTLGGLDNGKSKACNQGNQGNLLFYEAIDLKDAILEASKKYGISIKEIMKIVIEEGIEDLFSKENEKALRSWQYVEPETTIKLSTTQPIEIITTDNVDIANLKVLFRRYDVKFKLEEIEEKSDIYKK